MTTKVQEQVIHFAIVSQIDSLTCGRIASNVRWNFGVAMVNPRLPFSVRESNDGTQMFPLDWHADCKSAFRGELLNFSDTNGVSFRRLD